MLAKLSLLDLARDEFSVAALISSSATEFDSSDSAAVNLRATELRHSSASSIVVSRSLIAEAWTAAARGKAASFWIRSPRFSEREGKERFQLGTEERGGLCERTNLTSEASKV